MPRINRHLKRIGFDIAGFGLIILGLAIGWLPGPGGIPLILAGLGILSVHNSWAKSILDYSKKNGIKFVEIIYSGKNLNTKLHWLFEVLLVFLIISLLCIFKNWQIAMFCSGLLIVAFMDFWLTYSKQRS